MSPLFSLAVDSRLGRDQHQRIHINDESRTKLPSQIRAVPMRARRVGHSSAGILGSLLDHPDELLRLMGFPAEHVYEDAPSLIEDVRPQSQRKLGRIDDHPEAVGRGIARGRRRRRRRPRPKRRLAAGASRDKHTDV